MYLITCLLCIFYVKKISGDLKKIDISELFVKNTREFVGVKFQIAF